MKFLITGGAGMLGKEFTELLSAAPEPDRAFSFSHSELDITDRGHVAEVISQVKPDVVINCAAYTDVDGCEKDPGLAFLVNAEGPRILAEQVASAGGLLVHVSTDYVFDGRKREPYTEEDEPNPLSVYGKSKLAGERAVADSGCRHIIARVAWLYGPYGKNFVWSFVIERARAGKPLPIVTDQVSSPSYSLDVAQGILDLILAGARGLFHVSNSGSCSRVELAEAALMEANITRPIQPTTTAQLGLPAERPRFSALSTEKFRAAAGRPMPHWREGLRNFINRMKKLDIANIK